MEEISSLKNIDGRLNPFSPFQLDNNVSEGSEISLIKEKILDRKEAYSNSSFSDVLSGALDIAANVVAPGLGTIDNFSSLMQQQMLWQVEMQYYTAESNISKSKHEVAMAPIRNLRVG